MVLSQNHVFISFCSTEDTVQLLDLPNDLILAIMNKVVPHVLLLCSIIDIGNNRLKQLAFDKCQTIDLTFDFYNHHMNHYFNDFMPTSCLVLSIIFNC